MKFEKKQLFLMMLPAVLLFTFYYWFYLKNHSRGIGRLNGMISVLTLEVSNLPLKLAQEKKTLEEIQKKIPAIKMEISETQQKISTFEKSFQGMNSVETLFQINQIIAKNNLVLLKSDFQSQQIHKQSNELLEYYEESRLEQDPKAETGKLLKLEMIGSFQDFSQMISDINTLSSALFPLNITMRGFNKKKKLHQWQLILWI